MSYSFIKDISDRIVINEKLLKWTFGTHAFYNPRDHQACTKKYLSTIRDIDYNFILNGPIRKNTLNIFNIYNKIVNLFNEKQTRISVNPGYYNYRYNALPVFPDEHISHILSQNLLNIKPNTNYRPLCATFYNDNNHIIPKVIWNYKPYYYNEPFPYWKFSISNGNYSVIYNETFCNSYNEKLQRSANTINILHNDSYIAVYSYQVNEFPFVLDSPILYDNTIDYFNGLIYIDASIAPQELSVSYTAVPAFMYVPKDNIIQHANLRVDDDEHIRE